MSVKLSLGLVALVILGYLGCLDGLFKPFKSNDYLEASTGDCVMSKSDYPKFAFLVLRKDAEKKYAVLQYDVAGEDIGLGLYGLKSDGLKGYKKIPCKNFSNMPISGNVLHQLQFHGLLKDYKKALGGIK